LDLVQVVIYKLANNKELERLDQAGSTAEQEALADGFAAARALGMALGLMLRPEAFDGPGVER
jgi:hypothetical protein